MLIWFTQSKNHGLEPVYLPFLWATQIITHYYLWLSMTLSCRRTHQCMRKEKTVNRTLVWTTQVHSLGTTQPQLPACACMLSHIWLCNPMDYGPPGSSVHGILQARYWSGLSSPPPGDLPDPGIELASPVSPTLQVNSSPTAPSRKPSYLY